MDVLRNRQTDLTFAKEDQNGKFMIRATMSQKAMSDVQSYALKQNVATLHNRINELGVAEPVIAQQGADRIVVQLPGVQDTAKAKDILAGEQHDEGDAGGLQHGCGARVRVADHDGVRDLAQEQPHATGEIAVSVDNTIYIINIESQS